MKVSLRVLVAGFKFEVSLSVHEGRCKVCVSRHGMLSLTDDRLGHRCSGHGMHLNMLSCGHGCSGHRMNSNMEAGGYLCPAQSNMDVKPSCGHGCYGHHTQPNMDVVILLAWMLWSSYAIEHGCYLLIELSCAVEHGCLVRGVERPSLGYSHILWPQYPECRLHVHSYCHEHRGYGCHNLLLRVILFILEGA